MKKKNRNKKISPIRPIISKVMFLEPIYKWLCWVTNNEAHPKNEIEFDMMFFIVNTIALIYGTYLLIIYNQAVWIPFLVIEYSWALDNMRHNRDYLK